jgi:hypothetical protein
MMAKSFKKFRSGRYSDNEWGDDEDRQSDRKKNRIRDQRLKKERERLSSFMDNKDDDIK